MRRNQLLLAGIVLFSFAISVEARDPNPKKLQVFILAGQSNMVGHANVITLPRLSVDDRPEVQALGKLVFKEGKTVTRDAVDAQIALRIKGNEIRQKLRKNKELDKKTRDSIRKEISANDEVLKSKVTVMKEAFAVSKRVYITSIADRNRRSGPLTVGFGASPDKIGPELGFGLALEQKLDCPILLIKTSWGGKSLNYNFRPPSAGAYELNDNEKKRQRDPAKFKADAGQFYRMMTKQVHDVLADLKKHHPEYDADAGYDMAGFVWFQGFNDQFAPEYQDNYKQNMIHFIKDVRKEFKAPKMPFVIGVLGTGRTEEKVNENAVSQAQRSAAKAAEFKDNVVSVESYKVYDHGAWKVFDKGWQKHFAEWCAVGSDRPYHYLGSGKFFVRFGDSLAEGMHRLIKKQ